MYRLSNISIVVFSITLFISCSHQNNVIYVSADGDDNNKGTRLSPLATFEEARDRVREIISTGQTDEDTIFVCFRKGTYYFTQTGELGAEDRGRNNCPVKYMAYPGEKVIFSGGKSIDSNVFTEVDDQEFLQRIIDSESRDKIIQADLMSLGIEHYGSFRQHGFSIAILPSPMELFIDNEPMTIAKYPNEGRLPVLGVVKDCSKAISGDFSAIPGVISYDFDRPDYWTNAKDIWLWGYFMAGFADDNLRVATIDTAMKTIAMEHAHMFGMIPTDTTDEWGGKIVGYYAYNLPEEINMPGEYFIDREKGILYLYPPSGFETAKITLSMLEGPLLAVEHTSNIIVSGITFECARGMGVYLEDSENILFDNCVFRNLGTVAAMFGKGVSGADYPVHELTGYLKSRTIGNLKAHVYENTGFYNQAGTNCGLTNCTIYNTGTGGVILSGGNRADLTPGNNFVENCEIYDFNRWNKTYCAGVTLYGVENRIRNCYIHDAPHQGIAIFGNEHLIEKNHLEKLVMDVHDNGGIYIGRNPSERGNVIRHNYFSEMGTEGFKNCAIHLDDFACATLIEGNVFYKASKSDFGDILINGGSDNTIRDNVFINGSHVLWIEDPNMAIPPDNFNQKYGYNGLMGKRLYKDIDIRRKEWQDKYPEFNPYTDDKTPLVLKNNAFYNNFIVADRFIISKHGIDGSGFTRNENNYFASGNEKPDLINKEGKLKPDKLDLSSFIQGFNPIPADEIGLD